MDSEEPPGSSDPHQGSSRRDRSRPRNNKNRPNQGSNGPKGPPRDRPPRNQDRGSNPNQRARPAPGPGNEESQRQPGGGRRAKFGSGLTTNEPGVPDALSSAPTSKRPKQPRPPRPPPRTEPEGTDLTSTLIRGLRTPPFPDCMICFAPLRPEQPVWSCAPTIPISPTEGSEAQYCWTTFHLKCIKPWAQKSVKDFEAALRMRGDQTTKGEWRCPGCQGRRVELIRGYLCFCGSTPSPSAPRLATPHSCGNPCSRPRSSAARSSEYKCTHPCPLACHPGPCPPCKIVVSVQCSCPRSVTGQVRCSEFSATSPHSTVATESAGRLRISLDNGGNPSVTCGSICGRMLDCGRGHKCRSICHEGPCEPCSVNLSEKCTCSKQARPILCGGGVHDNLDNAEEEVQGDWTCGKICDESFECGEHTCKEICHAHTGRSSNKCPFSPDLVKTCPCGKSTIASPSALYEGFDFPPRQSCKSLIPTCTATCEKVIPHCGHICVRKCHKGSCSPCSEKVVRPCRCGAKIVELVCHELFSAEGGEEKEVLCDKSCTALRACGRHRCNRACCPLASLASVQATTKKGKGKQKQQLGADVAIGEEKGGLHECDLVCGRMLGCGLHRCEERDHKGTCGRCLRSTFEEISCPCGLTVFEPPIPCGIQIHCSYPCHRGSVHAECGHSKTPHACHSDSVPCPPCVHLTSKLCACGKKEVGNVRCSLEREKVGCGERCGKLMGCGGHRCERVCHAGECGQCRMVCGKPRKLCLPSMHSCTKPCHAPSTCPEDDPCESIIQLTCPCGRIKQSVHCGRSNSNPSSSSANNNGKVKCNNECAIAKRNARLADALGINKVVAEEPKVVYNDELVGFAKANPKFLPLVERTFVEFINSDRKNQVLPHMPPERRKFVHDLAFLYRMDTQLVDQEPHRSVQLIKRIDTRVPNPLLSASLPAPPPAAPNFGKLADLRGGANASSWRSGPPQGQAGQSASVKPASTRAWGNVVNASTSNKSAATGQSAAVVLSANPPAAVAARRASPVPRVPVAPPIQNGTTVTPTTSVPDSWEDD